MNIRSAEQAAFAAAVACATPAERAACLDAHCGSDAALRRRVEALLAAAGGGGFPGSPAGFASARRRNQRKTRRPHWPLQLLEKIGEGGCGVVYMAEAGNRSHRRVALKVIKPGMDTRSVVARFEAERQALAMMDHASIAQGLRRGHHAGRPAIFCYGTGPRRAVTTFCDEAGLPTGEQLPASPSCQAVQHHAPEGHYSPRGPEAFQYPRDGQ